MLFCGSKSPEGNGPSAWGEAVALRVHAVMAICTFLIETGMVARRDLQTVADGLS
jgi:hypothetical protein